MRKVIIILIFGFVLTGCSVTRKSKGDNITLTGNILEDVRNQNLTNSGFYIQKGEIEYITSNGKEKFLFTVKYEKPDRYLVSLKSRTGIEGVRIFVSGDTILANDRINKVLYSASPVYLQRNFGISLSLLPLIFGDIIFDRNKEKAPGRCIGNKITFDSSAKGASIEYEIDCGKRKLTMAGQVNSFMQKETELLYDQFSNNGSISFPKYIEMRQIQTNATIKINIIKIETPWTGNIDFVPGRGYEKMELL